MGDKAVTLDDNPLAQVLVTMSIEPCILTFVCAVTRR